MDIVEKAEAYLAAARKEAAEKGVSVNAIIKKRVRDVVNATAVPAHLLKSRK